MYLPTRCKVASLNIFGFPRDSSAGRRAMPPAQKPTHHAGDISLLLISRAQGHCKSYAISRVTDLPHPPTQEPALASLMNLWLLMATKRLPGAGSFTTHNVTQSLGDIQSLLGIQGKRSRRLAQGMSLTSRDTNATHLYKAPVYHQTVFWTSK